MQASAIDLAHRILEISDQLLDPSTEYEFQAARAQGVRELMELLQPPAASAIAMDALHMAFTLSRGQPRRRHCLELCAWELFSLSAVPTAPGETARALELLVLPFLLEVDPSKVSGPLFLQQVSVPVAQIVDDAQARGLLPGDRYFGGFDTLLTRQDLHAWGPQRICEAFIGAELGMEPDPVNAFPVFVDKEIESGCTVLAFLPLAATISPDMPKMLLGLQTAHEGGVADLVREAIQSANVPVTAVTSMAPCSFSQALLRTTGPSAMEIDAWLARAKSWYSIETVALESQGGGRAELRGKTAQQAEYVLASPLSFAEPMAALAAFVEQRCAAHGLQYSGTYLSSVPLSELVH